MRSRLFFLLALLIGLLAASTVVGCDATSSQSPTRVAAGTTPVKHSATKASAHVAHEKKARSAWNHLRANLRHDDLARGAALWDDDDDDGDEPDLTTASIWDDVDIDGSAGDASAGARVRPPHGRDLMLRRGAAASTIRPARGHDAGRERPPRA